MKKSTRMISLVGAGLMAVSALGFSGCGGNKVGDDEQTLQMFIGDFGYGTAWLDAVIENFKNEAWVKEKYPNLNIPTPQKNSERMYPATQITSGKTTIDLFFSGGSAFYYYFMTGADGKSYYENLSDVVAQPAYGESTPIVEKMDEIFRESYKITVHGEEGYYCMPWAQGPWGIFYNKVALEEKMGKGYVMPTTTDGLVQLCEDLKTGSNAKTPFVFCSAEDYQSFIVGTWWAQYEGRDNYEKFWLGVDENDFLNPEEFVPMKQKGKLRALEALEELIGKGSGNTHEYVNTMTFTQAQTAMMSGEGIMQVNGDWICNEMSVISSQEQLDRVSMMKTPVLSAIVEKLSFYDKSKAYEDLTDAEKAAYDAKLQSIIAEVDAGATSSAVEGVTANDFAIVKEARKMVNIIAGHDAVIPSYATAKGLAKDFLRYMAADKNLDTYMSVTKGCRMPYEYDVKTKNPDLYNSFSDMHKVKMDMLEDCVVKPMAETYPMKYIGMLEAMPSWSNISFCFTAANDADYHSALDIYNADINYYAKNNAHNWKQILINMGY